MTTTNMTFDEVVDMYMKMDKIDLAKMLAMKFMDTPVTPVCVPKPYVVGDPPYDAYRQVWCSTTTGSIDDVERTRNDK